jgi:two-component system cell cycle response regulator CpdR
MAEDDGAVREFVRRALVHGGHDVATANDGLDALDVDENFDFLITDIVMPGMDGIALALKVANEHPKTAILMMTGYAAERQRAHNLEELIHEVIAKPFSLKQICNAAEDAMSHRGSHRGRRTH